MFLIVFSILFVLPSTVQGNFPGTKKYVKRQVSLDDIIQGALNFVRPIIDSSQPFQTDLMTPKKLQSESAEGRDAEILGVPKYSTLDDVPICKSNSKICKFISCSAHNFKNDESISNLNLAAQILADTKLRKAITSDPNTLLTVCREQGLSVTQCKLFANAFQLLDRFISTIEPVGLVAKKLHRYIVKDDPYYDESDAPPVPIHPGTHQNLGSQTWSTHENNSINLEPMQVPKKFEAPRLQQSNPILSDPTKIFLSSPNLPNLSTTTAAGATGSSATKDSVPVASSTTTYSSTAFTFPPLFFTFPTLATFAPIMPAAVPQMPAAMHLMPKQLQNLLMPHFDSKFLPNMMPVPMPVMIGSPVGRPESVQSVEKQRNRRSTDYYDNIDEQDDAPNTPSTSRHNTGYDDEQRTIAPKKPKMDHRGLLDCIRLLEE